MQNELVDLFAQKFIARTDVKAIQHRDGTYMPIREPWQREDLEAHLAGSKTFGHYLVSKDDKAKLFCFDIDLEQMGWLPTSYDEAGVPQDFQMELELRTAWRDRSHIGRRWMKIQFHTIAHILAASIQKNLDIPCAVAYSGSKGVHVYGFTGLQDAADVRDGAKIVLDALGCFELKHGDHFYKHVNADKEDGYPNLSIELYPKQDSLGGKDLGNLLRLPLGRNLKTEDPTFFVDMTSAISDLTPVDPIFALTATDLFDVSPR